MYPEVSATESTQDPQGLLHQGTGRCCGLKGFFSTFNYRASKKPTVCPAPEKRSLPLQLPLPSETDKSTAGNKEINT